MPATDRTRFGLWIEPLDVLFFRGGRPFGTAMRAEGGLPQPQTLAGALRTAMLAAAGFDFAEFARRSRSGEFVAGGRALSDLIGSLGAPPGLTEAWFRGPWLMQRPVGPAIEPLL